MSVDELKIVIPYPSYIPRARGIHAVNKLNSCVKVHLSYDEKEILERCCDALGLSQSNLLRWLSVYAATQILKDKEKEHAQAVAQSWQSD